MIEKVPIEKNYLQIFEISQLSHNQLRILQKQEVPEYSSELIINGTLPERTLKIYVIDYGEYALCCLLMNTKGGEEK